MAIKAVKGIGKAFLKASRAKAAEKMKKLNKRDEMKFQGVYRKHRKALEKLNKPAKEELEKSLKSIRGRVTKGKSKGDMKDMMKAYQRYDSKIFKKGTKEKMYDDLPDIRQRFRGRPGRQRKLVKGVKNYVKRAEILQKDRLKRFKRDEPKEGKKK
jgi:hypothetical protein